jgi:hypothetical protein
MTYTDLYQILVEAEMRRDDESLPRDVRGRSAETVSICEEKLVREGLSRKRLIELAQV